MSCRMMRTGRRPAIDELADSLKPIKRARYRQDEHEDRSSGSDESSG